MKSTGIVRKVDELGRIVIPIELRRVLEIDIKDAMEIFVEDDGVCVAMEPNHAISISGHCNPHNNTTSPILTVKSLEFNRASKSS